MMLGYGSGLGMSGFGMGLGGIGGLLLLALLVLGGIYLFRALEHRDAPSASAPTKGDDAALRVLRERYARGEIDHDEYLHRKEGLSVG